MTYDISTAGYNDYFYNNYLNSGSSTASAGSTSIGGAADSSIYSEDSTSKKKKNDDDGKIGLGKILLNAGKGAVKFFTGMFTDENGNFSLGQTLKTAAIAAGIGAATVLTAGTAIPAIIAATGIGIAGIGTAKSIYDIATAQTDDGAEAAWQSFGSNITAGVLAMVGAKAIVKSSAATATEAAEYNGVSGLFKASRKVFKDSGEAAGKSFTGFKNAYKSAGTGFKAKGEALKGEFTNQKNTLTSKVNENLNKTLYGKDGSGKLTDKIKTAKEKKANLEKQIAKETDATKKAALQKQLKEIESEIKVKTEINNTSTWEEANGIIEKNENTLSNAQKWLDKNEHTASPEAVQRCKNIIARKQQEIEYGKSALEQRTAEARAIRSQIESKQKKIENLQKQENVDNTTAISKLQKEIGELQTKQENFKLPEKVSNETLTAANEKVTETETAYKNSKNALDEAVKKQGESGTSEVSINDLRTKAAEAKAEYQKAGNRQQSLQRQQATEASGGYNSYLISEVLGDAYQNPATMWLTLNAAGRQFGIESPYENFYSQLTTAEKEYFKDMNTADKAQLVNIYNLYAA